MDSNTIQEAYVASWRPVLAVSGLVIIIFMLVVLIFVDKKILDSLEILRKRTPDTILRGITTESAIRKTKYTIALHFSGIIFGSIVMILFSFVSWDMALCICLFLGIGIGLVALVGNFIFDVFWGFLELKFLHRLLRAC